MEQVISQVDVKKRGGEDISGAEEKKFRDSATQYLNAQKNNLSSQDYAKLEASVVAFLNNVDTDFDNLVTKYEALKTAIRVPRTDLKIEVNNEQIKNSAELILGSVRNTKTELTNKIAELSKKEQSYLNFISPENMLGLSTRLLDGNTVTGLKIQSMNAFAERSSASEKSLGKIINDLSSGKSFTDIQKNPSLKIFFASPEGLYMIDKSNKVEDSECYQKYLLNTARLYNKLNLPIIAESYYDKLDGTIFENQIKGERLSKVERFRQGGLTTFANDFLSLDQLAIMAAGGALGKGLGLVVGKSEALTRGAIVASKAIEGSKMAKVLLPGVQVIKSGTGDKIAISIGKGIINIGFDVTKFAAYSYAAEQIGGEDAGKAVRLALAIIPGAKAGFETQMSMNIAKDASSQTPKLADWMITKYGKDGTENMIYTGLVEKAKAEAMRTGRLSKGIPESALQELGATAKQTIKNLEMIAASGKNTNSPELVTKAFDAATSILNTKLNPVQKDALANAANYVKNRGGKINEVNQQEVIELLTKPQGVKGSSSFSLDQANAIIKNGALGDGATKVEKVAATVAVKSPTVAPKIPEISPVNSVEFGTPKYTYKIELLSNGEHVVKVKSIGEKEWRIATTNAEKSIGSTQNYNERIAEEVKKLKANIKSPSTVPVNSPSVPPNRAKNLDTSIKKTEIDIAKMKQELQDMKQSTGEYSGNSPAADIVKKQQADITRAEKHLDTLQGENTPLRQARRAEQAELLSQRNTIGKMTPEARKVELDRIKNEGEQLKGLKGDLKKRLEETKDRIVYDERRALEKSIEELDKKILVNKGLRNSFEKFDKIPVVPENIGKDPSKLSNWMKVAGVGIGAAVLIGGALYLIDRNKEGEVVAVPAPLAPEPIESEEPSVPTPSVPTRPRNPNAFNEGSLERYKDRINNAIEALTKSGDPDKKALGELLQKTLASNLTKNNIRELQIFMIGKWSESEVSNDKKPDGLFGDMTMKTIEDIVAKNIVVPESVVAPTTTPVGPVLGDIPSVAPTPEPAVASTLETVFERSTIEMKPRQIGDLITTLSKIETDFPGNNHPNFKLDYTDIKVLSELSPANVNYLKNQLKTEANNTKYYKTPLEIKEHQDYWNAYATQLDDVLKNYKGEFLNIKVGSNRDIAGLKEADMKIKALQVKN